jgi:nucleoside-diphosphate-sugar epimerase
MRVVVMGGTGRTGRHLLPLLRAAGHEVTLFGRRAPDGWDGRFVQGDVDDAVALAPALEGADAVLSCLASGRGEAVCLPATQAVLRAGRPDLRHIVVGGAAVDAPGDAKGAGDRVAGLMMRLFAGRMLAERQAEYAALAGSGRPFTFLRPPQLGDRAATGHWTLTHDRPASIRIERADLAAAMVAVLGRPDLVGRAPFVAGVKRASSPA